MRELEKGAESVDFNVDGPYEVEHLSRSVQSMVSTMRHLMEDILRQEEEKRRSELDVLQSQINPHFLYNTLDSVVWMTENGRTQEAVVMLTALARFFRISLSKGSNIIPIGDEIEHARNYLTIQKMRYNEKLRYEIDLDPQTEDCLLPKLILQPLVENAIYHGIKVKQQGGTVRIESLLEEDRLLITVEDDGVGMTPEQLEAMHSMKTGALIRSAAVLGCLAAGAPRDVVMQADLYAAKIGLAFQIVDDILDATEESEKLGKSTSDADNNKTTYITLYGVEKAREMVRRLVLEADLAVKGTVLDDEMLYELADTLAKRHH